MKKAGKTILYILLAVTVVLTVVLTIKRSAEGRKLLPEDTSGIQAAEPAEPMIKVYVTGEVNLPGIVEIPKGSTLLDAVEECGGFTEDASSNINLVYELDGNVTLVIKSYEDGGGANIMEEAGDVVVVNEENGLIDGKININNADASSLMLLHGIGEKTAEDIIEYRNSSGLFRTIEDLMNVPGIKESKFAKVCDMICVD